MLTDAKGCHKVTRVISVIDDNDNDRRLGLTAVADQPDYN